MVASNFVDQDNFPMAEVESTERRPGFLVVEDDEHVARWLTRVFSSFRPATHVGTVREARTFIAAINYRLAAVVTDINLPDGSGFDVVRMTREHRPSMSVLVLTSSVQPKVVNTSFLLGASFLTKPTTEESLSTFARKALAMERVADVRVVAALERFVEEWALSEREAELLAHAVADKPRAELASTLGVSENTAKSHVRRLLQKSGTTDLEHVVRLVLRRALSGS